MLAPALSAASVASVAAFVLGRLTSRGASSSDDGNVVEALRLRERAVTATHNGIIVTDATVEDYPIVYVNRGFERITGYSSEETVGRNARFLQNHDSQQPALDELRDAIESNAEWSGLFRNYRKDGSVFWNEHNVSPVFDAEGRVVNHVGVINDVTERKRLEERLEHQAFHDALTGLPNRQLLLDRLRQALNRAERAGTVVAVLFVDLDNFKYVNDSLGHEAGDRLLSEAAERLESCLRPSDTVARLGGDEFVVLLEDTEGEGEAVRVAERMAQEMGAPFVLGAHEVFAPTSIGIALGGRAAPSVGPEQLLGNADAAMYEAKKRGKARYAVHEEAMSRKARARLGLENDLRRAVERGEFEAHYQPQVALGGEEAGRIMGVEALARWRRPEHGLVPPAEFVPLAEETGLIVEIGWQILREVCGQARAWRDLWRDRGHAGARFPTTWVNLSARQLREPDLLARVAGALEDAGLDPGDLGFEVTESVLMEDGRASVARLEDLEALGVKLAIDDFGTGYSSLSYLKRLPVGLLKVDRSFVDGLGRDQGDETIVSAVIGLGRAMRLEVLAEGVESADQLARLRDMGCDLAQGYHLARPVPGDEISSLWTGADRSLLCP